MPPRQPANTRATLAYRVDLVLRLTAQLYLATGGTGETWAAQVEAFITAMELSANNSIGGG
jgi:hypothetical protein